MIFRTLYCSTIIKALKDSKSSCPERPIEDLVGMIECRMAEQFDKLEWTGFQSWKLRQELL